VEKQNTKKKLMGLLDQVVRDTTDTGEEGVKKGTGIVWLDQRPAANDRCYRRHWAWWWFLLLFLYHLGAKLRAKLLIFWRFLRDFPDWLARAVNPAILSLARLLEASILFFSSVKTSTSPQLPALSHCHGPPSAAKRFQRQHTKVQVRSAIGPGTGLPSLP